MNENFTKLSADTSVSELLSLLREGRLYVASSSEELVQKAVSSALKRVRKIDGLCNEPYRKVIAEIWESVLYIRSIRARLLYQKGKKKDTINWVFVSVIVKFLHSRNVYALHFNDLLKAMYGNVVIAKSVNNPNYMLIDIEESLIKSILKKFYDGKILNRK